METVDRSTGEIVHLFYRRSDDLSELFTALAKAQGEFGSAERAGENPGFKRGNKAATYATLESVMEATREGRKNHALAVMQMPGNYGNNIAVTTLLGHSSGQWIESTLYVAPGTFNAQGAGSVITYLRRYALMSILGIAPEDDDGNAAVAQPHVVAQATRMTPAVAASTPSRDVAVAIANRIRSEIKGARDVADLNSAGIYGKSAANDRAAIEAQQGGDRVWQSLVDLDAARREALFAPPDDPILDLASVPESRI